MSRQSNGDPMGDVDEHLQVTTLARDGGGGDGRLKIGSGHAHAEVHALAAFQGTRDVVPDQAAPTGRSRNLIAASEPSTMKAASATSCAITKGGSDCVGASVLRAGTF